jgi:hypothetical protein
LRTKAAESTTMRIAAGSPFARKITQFVYFSWPALRR